MASCADSLAGLVNRPRVTRARGKMKASGPRRGICRIRQHAVPSMRKRTDEANYMRHAAST